MVTLNLKFKLFPNGKTRVRLSKLVVGEAWLKISKKLSVRHAPYRVWDKLTDFFDGR